MNALLTRRTFVAGSLLLPIALSSCGGEQVDAAAPPEISYGRDTCERCGMIIADERFAGGLVAADGTTVIFDDIGEMLQSARETATDDGLAWVHDWESRDWIETSSAFFVRGSPETTPMGTGLHAFRSQEGAAAFASEQGIAQPPRSWADLLAEEAPATPGHQM